MPDTERARKRSERSSRSTSPHDRRNRSRSPREARNKSKSPMSRLKSSLRGKSPTARDGAGPGPIRGPRPGLADEEVNLNANKSLEAKVKIDREKTCPLLLRVFCNQGRHHRADEYARNNTPANELQIYTWCRQHLLNLERLVLLSAGPISHGGLQWKDASLKELMNLVKEVNPDARKKGTYFDFATVFPNQRSGGFIVKDIGTTCSGMKCPDDSVTLESKKFQIGDYLDIAISPPRERNQRF